MRTIILLSLALAGCGRNMVGDWEGECEFDAYDVEVQFEIEEDKNGELKGEGGIQFVYYGVIYDFDGDLEGVRDGTSVEMELDFGADGSMDIEGELIDGDVLEGTCDSGGVEGDAEIERDN